MLAGDRFHPTVGMAAAAARGLVLRREFGRGGTPVGIMRARDLSNGRSLPLSTVKRMYSFFARHEVDKKGSGFKPGSQGYPSSGAVAWLLWGGEPGRVWATAIRDRAIKAGVW